MEERMNVHVLSSPHLKLSFREAAQFSTMELKCDDMDMDGMAGLHWVCVRNVLAFFRIGERKAHLYMTLCPSD